MPDERRPPPPGRGPRDRTPSSRPAAPLTGPIAIDSATNDALLLFNARLAAQAENEKAERRVQKAAKAKDDAAAIVRNLENDTKATTEARAQATAAYHAAVEAWERAKRGEADPSPSAKTTITDDEPADDETTADETTTDETTTDEITEQSEHADTEQSEHADAATPSDH